MATYTTVDGSDEDVAAFASFVMGQYPEAAGQLPTLLVDLFPQVWLRWRVTRFYFEGFPVMSILSLVKASPVLLQLAAAEGAVALDGLLDFRMEPYIQMVIVDEIESDEATLYAAQVARYPRLVA